MKIAYTLQKALFTEGKLWVILEQALSEELYLFFYIMELRRHGEGALGTHKRHQNFFSGGQFRKQGGSCNRRVVEWGSCQPCNFVSELKYPYIQSCR